MYISFDQLSDSARIWVYQSNRSLTPDEQTTMRQKAQLFLEAWASHGHPLKSSADIRYDQFLILAVEESFQGATGCAVDASIQFIRELEQAFQITLMDRTQAAFRKGSAILTVPMHQLSTQVQTGTIAPDTLTFDNTVTRKGELATKWQVRAQEAWLSTYFRK